MEYEGYKELVLAIMRQCYQDYKHRKHLRLQIDSFLKSEYYENITSWMQGNASEQIKKKSYHKRVYYKVKKGGGINEYHARKWIWNIECKNARTGCIWQTNLYKQ